MIDMAKLLSAVRDVVNGPGFPFEDRAAALEALDAVHDSATTLTIGNSLPGIIDFWWSVDHNRSNLWVEVDREGRLKSVAALAYLIPSAARDGEDQERDGHEA